VLISCDHSGSYTAKVTDFGYSTLVSSDDDLIMMPKSKPWHAPEWHHRGIKLSEAMKMDVYSFGMLCLWLLFKENEGYPKGSEATTLGELKSTDKLRDLAHDLVLKTEDLDDQKRRRLDKFFELSLAHEPKARTSDFKGLLQLLAPNR